MRRLTFRTLYASSHCLRLGGMTFTPVFPLVAALSSPKLARDAARSRWFWRQANQDPITRSHRNKWTRDDVRRDPHGVAFVVEQFYRHARNMYDSFNPPNPPPEPYWIRYVPAQLRGRIRARWLVTEGVGTNLFTMQKPFPVFIPPPYYIPRSGIGYLFTRPSLFPDLFDALNLRRIEELSQFGLLRDPIPQDQNGQGPGEAFGHNRFVHVTDAAAIAILICYNNRHRLSRRLREHIVVAAATHDLATPAYGDTAKVVDPLGLDEDRHYRTMLHGKKWRSFARRRRLSRKLLAKIVRGDHPVASRILDIADKLSYVLRDAEVLDSFTHTADLKPDGTYSWPTYFQHSMDAMRWTKGIAEKPVGSLWETVRVSAKGEVYFTEPERLARFLTLRAHLTAGVYLNPSSRSREHTAGVAIIRCMYGQELSARKLRRMNNQQMIDLVRDRSGYVFDEVRQLQQGVNPHREAFTDEQAACNRERELVAKGNIVVLEDFRSITGDGTKMLVKTPAGVRSFRSACRKHTAEIRRVFEPSRRIFLYAVPVADLVRDNGMKPEFADRLLAFERQRVGLPSTEEKPGTS
jgi:alkylhydroperoxidase family enzyme